MGVDIRSIYEMAFSFYMSGMTNEQFCECTGIGIQRFRNQKYTYKEIFEQAQRDVITLSAKRSRDRILTMFDQQQKKEEAKQKSSEVENKIIVEWPNGTKMEFFTIEEFNETLGIFPVFFMRYCGYRQFNVMRDHQVCAAFQHAPGDHSILPLVHLTNTPWWMMPLEHRFRIFDEDGCRLVGSRLISHLVHAGREREMDEAVEHLKLWNKIQEWKLRLPGPYSTKLPGEKWPKPVYELRPEDLDDDPRRQTFDFDKYDS